MRLDHDEAQDEHLERVRCKLATPIAAFCRHRVGDFHMADLRSYLVARDVPFSPDSPSRVLRDLRASGEIDYVVVNRKDSLYRITATKHGS